VPQEILNNTFLRHQNFCKLFPMSMNLTFLALGDSYTIGEGVPEEQRWPAQLVFRLNEVGIAFELSQIIAKTGWTTAELSTAMAVTTFNPPYECVSLLIGVNNQYRGYSVEVYQAEFSTLLNQAIALAGNRPDHVLVLSIPDWSVTPFAQRSGRDSAHIAEEIDKFNRVNFLESQKRKVHYVDITPLTRQWGAEAEMLAEDSLHPSGAMYQLWIPEIFPVVQKIFSAAKNADA